MKTEARKILDARRASYGSAGLPSGYMDETELLLWQQDIAERREIAAKKKAKSGKVTKKLAP